jgi:hypothetical protein
MSTMICIPLKRIKKKLEKLIQSIDKTIKKMNERVTVDKDPNRRNLTITLLKQLRARALNLLEKGEREREGGPMFPQTLPTDSDPASLISRERERTLHILASMGWGN